MKWGVKKLWGTRSNINYRESLIFSKNVFYVNDMIILLDSKKW